MVKQYKAKVQENETVCDSATVDKVQYSCDYCSEIFKSIKSLRIILLIILDISKTVFKYHSKSGFVFKLNLMS